VSPRTDAPAWRWGNIPIPEAHLVGLVTGILLQVITPWSLPWPAWIGHGCGWPLILAGLWLGAWAVRAAAAVDLERPHQLVDSGPYAYGRNPMYVAWTLGYWGSRWLPAPPGRYCSCRWCWW
jgi:protein-S-isoprenylcysteine O-methyltransferase Ste14